MLWSKQDLGQHQLCDRVTSGELSRSLSWYVTVVQLVTLFHGFLEQDKEVSEGKKKGWKGGSIKMTTSTFGLTSWGRHSNPCF